MKSPEKPTLVADIGGTNSRFALAHVNNGRALDDQYHIDCLEILQTANYESLQIAADHYLEKIVPDLRPSHAVIAVAAPVIGDYVKFANCAWEFRAASLKAALSLEKIFLMNDFAAIANAVPYLSDSSLVQIGGGEKMPHQPMVVLGPGTGMGAAGLVPVGDHWKIIPGEAGHIGFAPSDQLECEILQCLHQSWPRVSVERLLSGQGLVLLYETLAKIEGIEVSVKSPELITQAALQGDDPFCEKVLNIFCAMLGSFAGDMALMFNASGGVYLAGGILPKIQDFLLNSRFRERFESKGRVTYMDKVPTYQIVEQQPALVGAAMWARRSL